MNEKERVQLCNELDVFLKENNLTCSYDFFQREENIKNMLKSKNCFKSIEEIYTEHIKDEIPDLCGVYRMQKISIYDNIPLTLEDYLYILKNDVLSNEEIFDILEKGSSDIRFKLARECYENNVSHSDMMDIVFSSIVGEDINLYTLYKYIRKYKSEINPDVIKYIDYIAGYEPLYNLILENWDYEVYEDLMDFYDHCCEMHYDNDIEFILYRARMFKKMINSVKIYSEDNKKICTLNMCSQRDREHSSSYSMVLTMLMAPTKSKYNINYAIIVENLIRMNEDEVKKVYRKYIKHIIKENTYNDEENLEYKFHLDESFLRQITEKNII